MWDLDSYAAASVGVLAAAQDVVDSLLRRSATADQVAQRHARYPVPALTSQWSGEGTRQTKHKLYTPPAWRQRLCLFTGAAAEALQQYPPARRRRRRRLYILLHISVYRGTLGAREITKAKRLRCGPYDTGGLMTVVKTGPYDIRHVRGVSLPPLSGMCIVHSVLWEYVLYTSETDCRVAAADYIMGAFFRD